ncbi:preprotein translocase subunit YajC [Tsuneonella sp. HG222]
MKTHLHTSSLAAMAAALILPASAAAQQVQGEPVLESGSAPRVGHVEVTPYIEAAQVFTTQLEPINDSVTYTSVAAGVDASVQGRNSAGSASVRYERRFGYDSGFSDSDTVSGIARASVGLGSPNVTIEAGALASRTRVDSNGVATTGAFAQNDSQTSQVYSGYVGPSIRSRQGAVEIEGHYRFGYTRVEAPDAVVIAPAGPTRIDLADDSTTHSANARVGLAPRTVLPVGVGVGGGWNEQNTSNLDQRVRDRHARADVSLPVSESLALVGGVGYEDVQISSRDAVRDPVTGAPVVGPDGRYVTNEAAPRVIAYETDGLIWDAGVMWRPSRRTSLQAFVGKRYDSTTYYGSFAYAPSTRQSINLSVYDGIQTFGGVITDRLAGLPAQFQAIRNPFSGDVGGCVTTTQGNNCLGGAFASLNSAVFRNRGVSLSYGLNLGRTQLGLGAGYDRRKFIAAPGTVLGAANGVVDESYWVAANLGTQLDDKSSITSNVYASWYDSGLSGDMALGYSASVAYARRLFGGLSGTAAVGLDGVDQDNLPDLQSASALVGLRYSF